MEEMATILLIEDDQGILRSNRRILEHAGYTVLCAQNLKAAREVLREIQPDLLLLDVMLPDGNGLDFCREIHDEISSPVLFLTGVDGQDNKIKGLENGGSDYITKPYHMDELLARVRAQLRTVRKVRRVAQQQQTLTRGPLTMDLVALRVYLEGKDLELTARQFSVLLCLLKHEGEILSPQELYKEAWNQPMEGDANALWKCISRIKTVLADSEISLMNYRGKGYMLEILGGNKTRT